MKQKLYITSEADRLAVVAALVKNGYTVRTGKEKQPGKRSCISFVEYWMETVK